MLLVASIPEINGWRGRKPWINDLQECISRIKKWLAGTQTMDQMVRSITEINGLQGRIPRIKKWFAGTQTMDQNNFFGAALFYIYNFLILCYLEPSKGNIIHTLQRLFVKAIDIIDDYIISIRIIKIACH